MRAGFYEKIITPPLGCDMPGYFNHRFAEDVRDELHAKAVAIEQGGNTVILIVIDIEETTDEICNPVCERITKFTGVPKENIMICGTHTHMGPPVCGNYNEHRTADYSYFDVSNRLIADAGILAFQRMEEATAKIASSEEKGLGFNRNYLMKDGSIRTNPGWKNENALKPFGPNNDEFANIFFFDKNENPIGAIMNFSCHHDSIGGAWGKKYSADYSGYLACEMKKEFGIDFVNVFMSYPNGNINHIDINREKEKYDHPRYIDIGKTLAEGVRSNFKKATELKIDEVKSLKEYVKVKKRYFPKEEIEYAKKLMETMSLEGLKFSIDKTDSDEYKRAIASVILEIAEKPDVMDAYVQTIKIGDCAIFGLIGEQYVEFGLELSEKSPAKYNLVASHANGGPSCYIPVKEAYGTTIYEAQPNSAYLDSDAGSTMVNKALEQAAKLF